mgnify:CR=1 FL=1|jgi:hypothetical protein
MRNIAGVFGECNTILFAFYFYHSEKVERWFTQIGADKKRRYLNVEWRKGVPETSPPSYIQCHPGQAGVLDGSVTIRWGGIA